jgi:hypothetical protein
VQLEGLGQLKKIYLIGTPTHDIPAFSRVPKPTKLPHAPHMTQADFTKFNIFMNISFTSSDQFTAYKENSHWMKA